MTPKFTSFDDTTIVTVKVHKYIINFWLMTKSKAVNRIKNTDLSRKSGQLSQLARLHYIDVTIR